MGNFSNKKIGATDLARLRVLIVENNNHLRTILKVLLNAIGICHIAECKTGEEALSSLDAVRPHFIVSDYLTAPMDGVEFARSIRKHNDAAIAAIPIIMLSGRTARRRIEEARDAGVTEMLAKPVTGAGLLQRIEEIILRPRPFVRAANYLGPCRRRQMNPDYVGPWRRASDHETDVGESLAKDRAGSTK